MSTSRQPLWRLAMVVLAVLFAATRPLPAQTDFRSAMDVPALLKALDSAVDTTRANAFYSLLWRPGQGPYDSAARTSALLKSDPKRSAVIASTLRRALDREERRLKAPGAQELTGLYKTFHGDLKKSVAALPPASTQNRHKQ